MENVKYQKRDHRVWKTNSFLGAAKNKSYRWISLYYHRWGGVHDLQHIDHQFLLDSFSIQIHSEIENWVSDAKIMMKLSLVIVTLEDYNISAYWKELEEIQNKYFIAKLEMENVFIPNYDSMMIILNAYRAFRDKLVMSR